MHAEFPPIAWVSLGLAFEIPDLLLARAVAAAQGLRLAVELDHHTDCDELEEALALYSGNGEACRWVIWRSATAVVVQPMPGRPRRFASLELALAWLAPDRPEPLTEIAPLPASPWPEPLPAAETGNQAVKGDGLCPHPTQA